MAYCMIYVLPTQDDEVLANESYKGLILFYQSKFHTCVLKNSNILRIYLLEFNVYCDLWTEIPVCALYFVKYDL